MLVSDIKINLIKVALIHPFYADLNSIFKHRLSVVKDFLFDAFRNVYFNRKIKNIREIYTFSLFSF